MKAKSRRRLLISSVAMLLVAMLALGTATFAWFTTTTNTTAHGIEVKTNKTSILKVSSMQSAWTTDLNYATDTATKVKWQKDLQPASTANGIDWFKAEALNGGEDFQANASTITSVDEYNDKANVFFNMLNVKNEGNETYTNIKIKLENIYEQLDGNDASHNYLRVALVPSDCTTDAGRATAKVSIPDGKTFASYVKGATSGDSANALTAANLTSTSAVATSGTSIEETIASLDPGDAVYYMLLIWFEGQDTDCADRYSGNAMPELTFTVTAD